MRENKVDNYFEEIKFENFLKLMKYINLDFRYNIVKLLEIKSKEKILRRVRKRKIRYM